MHTLFNKEHLPIINVFDCFFISTVNHSAFSCIVRASSAVWTLIVIHRSFFSFVLATDVEYEDLPHTTMYFIDHICLNRVQVLERVKQHNAKYKD
jgi:hypothetical protein